MISNLTSYRLTTFVVMLLACLVGHGQKTAVSGKVTDAATGETLPFVNVVFVDTKSGTTTDLDGNYSIETY